MQPQLVACIMPDAIRRFLAQDYPEKEVPIPKTVTLALSAAQAAAFRQASAN